MSTAAILDPFSPSAIDAQSQYLSFGSLFDVIDHQQQPPSSLPQRTSSPSAGSAPTSRSQAYSPLDASSINDDWHGYPLEDLPTPTSSDQKNKEATTSSPKPEEKHHQGPPPPIIQRSSICGYHPASSAPKLTNKYSIDSIASTASGSSSGSSSHIITPRASLSSLAGQAEEPSSTSSSSIALPGQSPSPTKIQVEKKTSMYSLTDVMFPHADGGKADVYGNIGSYDLQPQQNQQQQLGLVGPYVDYSALIASNNAGAVHHHQQQDPTVMHAALGSVEDFSWILDASATDNDSSIAASSDQQQQQQLHGVAPSYPLLPSASIVDKASWQQSNAAAEAHEPVPLLTPLSSATQAHFHAGISSHWTSVAQPMPAMVNTSTTTIPEERPMTAPFHENANATLIVPSAAPHDMRKTKSSDGICHVRDLFAFHPQDLNNRRRASAFTTVPQTHLPVTPPRSTCVYQGYKQSMTQSLGARPIKRAESSDQSSHSSNSYAPATVVSAPMMRPAYMATMPAQPYPFSTGYSLEQQYPTYSMASVLAPAPMPQLHQSFGAAYTSAPMQPSLSASVLQPAPTDLSTMPALSSEWVGSMTPKAPKAPRYTSQPPVLTSTPLTHGLSRLAVNSPRSVRVASAAGPSVVAPASSSSRPKIQSRSTSTTMPTTPSAKKSPVVKARAAKPKTPSPTQPFMGFINFTPADAAQIISAVAPSGSLKRKRERESSFSSDDASASPKRSKA